MKIVVGKFLDCMSRVEGSMSVNVCESYFQFYHSHEQLRCDSDCRCNYVYNIVRGSSVAFIQAMGTKESEGETKFTCSFIILNTKQRSHGFLQLISSINDAPNC